MVTSETKAPTKAAPAPATPPYSAADCGLIEVAPAEVVVMLSRDWVLSRAAPELHSAPSGSGRSAVPTGPL